MSRPAPEVRPCPVAERAPGSAVWRPLLDGESAGRARDAVLAIAEALRELPPAGSQGDAPGLSHGHAGRALFFTYLAQALDEPVWLGPAGEALDAASAALAERAVGPELLGGFTGVGWTSFHLADRLFPAAEAADAGSEIDAVLEQLLDGRWAGPYDLVGGLAGFGLYALEGPPRAAAERCLGRVVSELLRRSVVRDGGRTWHTRPELLPAHQRREAPDGYYNLGLAHGVAGAIVVLARARATGHAMAGSGGDDPLREAVDWLLGHDQGDGAQACFGNWIAAGADGAPRPADEERLTRLAWCYGDVGIAGALQVAARAAGEPAWSAAALRVAHRAAGRPAERSGVRDAGLCHGAAGVAHVFNRLAQVTGDARLADAALRAYGRALDLRRPGEGVGGYLAWEPSRGGWTVNPGFLTGAAGIGLALLAALTSLEPDWDRVLGLSTPAPHDPPGRAV